MLQIRQINENITLGLLDLNWFAKTSGLHLKREQEKAGTIYLLEKMVNKSDFELAYTEQRKPYIKHSSEHISISHSHDKLAVIINKQTSTGIDIELVRDKVQQIQHKFLNQSEQKLADNNTDNLICFWAAKETMYKIYGLKEVDFKENLFIEEFDDTEIVGKIVMPGFKKRYRLASERHNDYRLVYALDEI